MGKKQLPKHSQRTRYQIRNQLTLFQMVIAMLIMFPGQVTLPARDFGISTQQVYSMIRCHCRQTQFINDGHRMAVVMRIW
ncbi:MAG: hypothetical protein EZS28_039451 [Streblomastix strix]|uniref:Uncharacterized protein n=1 Tax=Streblomastix strix TaxID=222440 RepID=A0A5J4U505_9EUKA|nr:MAG: hypothetical protein EZS28_039451 [Streblomastix strix]